MTERLYIMAVVYLLGLSLAGFVSMGIDKKRAVRQEWRIPEKTLLLLALFGGGIGSFLGMRCFRHKTKHLAFRILLPLSAIGYLYLLYAICTKLMLNY